MLIDVSSHAPLILLRVQSFFTIEEPQAGYRLSFDLRLPNEPAMKIVRERTVNFLTYSAKAGIIEI